MDSELRFRSYEPNAGTAPNLSGEGPYGIFGKNRLIFSGI